MAEYPIADFYEPIEFVPKGMAYSLRVRGMADEPQVQAHCLTSADLTKIHRELRGSVTTGEMGWHAKQ